MEADAINRVTLKIHEREKKHADDIKARFGRINNTYAPDSLTMHSYGE